MTQQPLPLDQFAHIRAMVAARIDVAAYQAVKEAHEKAEFKADAMIAEFNK